MLKIIVVGYLGRLGGSICRLAETMADVEVVAGVDLVENAQSNTFPTYQGIFDCVAEADCIIDCSIAPTVPDRIDYALKTATPLVVCTTGLSAETISFLNSASKKIPVFRSANMSLGINLICSLSEKLARILPNAGFDIEIIEKHHNQKLDAPSGTALMLADAINHAGGGDYEYIYDRSNTRAVRGKKELGIHAIRGGTIIGDHDVVFAGTDEVIEIKHSIASREAFAVGALKAALYTASKPPGLYDMRMLIDEA